MHTQIEMAPSHGKGLRLIIAIHLRDNCCQWGWTSNIFSKPSPFAFCVCVCFFQSCGVNNLLNKDMELNNIIQFHVINLLWQASTWNFTFTILVCKMLSCCIYKNKILPSYIGIKISLRDRSLMKPTRTRFEQCVFMSQNQRCVLCVLYTLNLWFSGGVQRIPVLLQHQREQTSGSLSSSFPKVPTANGQFPWKFCR